MKKAATVAAALVLSALMAWIVPSPGSVSAGHGDGPILGGFEAPAGHGDGPILTGHGDGPIL